MSQTIAPVLGEATIQELREAVRGEILTPSDDGYVEAARIWNGAHDGRRPALVVRCTGAADVIAAVGFARSNDLPIAVRGGGHSIAGFSTCDDGIVIDLSPMNGVRVDPETRRATVGGGAVWADVDHETQAHGLATTGGLVSSTGVAGFTLGGGIGWLMRKHGLACDNLVAADVVTADGRLVHASETENADLLWGLRGGGGNFGIVTQFELAAASRRADGLRRPDLLPGRRRPRPAADVPRLGRRRARRDHRARQPHDRAAAAGDPGGVARQEGGCVHRRLSRPARRRRAVWCGSSARSPSRSPTCSARCRTTAIQTLLDPLWGKGIHAYFKATNLGPARRRADRPALRAPPRGPGRAVRDPRPPDGRRGRLASATTPQRSPSVRCRSCSTPSRAGTIRTQARRTRDWARDVIDAASDASTGRAYVNFLGDTDAARASYGEGTYARLVALKNEYDPTNVFRLNQNIEPETSGE